MDQKLNNYFKFCCEWFVLYKNILEIHSEFGLSNSELCFKNMWHTPLKFLTQKGRDLLVLDSMGISDEKPGLGITFLNNSKGPFLHESA